MNLQVTLIIYRLQDGCTSWAKQAKKNVFVYFFFLFVSFWTKQTEMSCLGGWDGISEPVRVAQIVCGCRLILLLSQPADCSKNKKKTNKHNLSHSHWVSVFDFGMHFNQCFWHIWQDLRLCELKSIVREKYTNKKDWILCLYTFFTCLIFWLARPGLISDI